ncbi:hypothetical protein AWZ03_004446 [Drosophila navojoa]|uniref:Uncharacterized protein n=1 Tax=Drosophila navojoa TaxID=7232 RepID=A0A484BJW1_DRONA|nr:hypothetical protein AWZ03_004446 [Drosophila navojoa]
MLQQQKKLLQPNKCCDCMLQLFAHATCESHSISSSSSSTSTSRRSFQTTSVLQETSPHFSCMNLLQHCRTYGHVSALQLEQTHEELPLANHLIVTIAQKLFVLIRRSQSTGRQGDPHRSWPATKQGIYQYVYPIFISLPRASRPATSSNVEFLLFCLICFQQKCSSSNNNNNHIIIKNNNNNDNSHSSSYCELKQQESQARSELQIVKQFELH